MKPTKPIRAGDVVRMKSGGSLCFRVVAVREALEGTSLRAPWGEWYDAGYFTHAERGAREIGPP